ncbi:MAG: hypothetical protein WA584_00495 [Pyrinomonadaceae bacterium]
MAISNAYLENMSEPDKDSYIKLRQALDSLIYVALTEFDLSDFRKDKTIKITDKEELDAVEANRENIANIVSKAVQKVMVKIARERTELWVTVESDRAVDFATHSRKILGTEEFKKHSDILLGDKTANEIAADIAARGGDTITACPPGFMLVDGYCVPI